MSHHVEVLFKILLASTLLSSIVALVSVWPGSFPMNESAEVRVKGVLCLVVLALGAWRHLISVRLPERRAGGALAIAAVLSVVAYYNFGTFHGHTFVHNWEQFHYYLGSKYFPELGYDGLYSASVAAQVETFPRRPLQHHVRDLKTNQVVPTGPILAQRKATARRFTTERWQSFLVDHRHFLAVNSTAYVNAIRKDHGYNSPPPWNLVARFFSAPTSASRTSQVVLGSLDVVLLTVLFTAIFITYGSRIGCWSIVLFGLGYLGRFYWIGGAFLRLDWLAAVVVGICLLERQRFGAAGLLFGYAAMVRLFPVLFLFGPAIVAFRELCRGKRPRWAFDLGLGFVVSVTLGIAAGSLAGRGLNSWQEFFHAIKLHEKTWLTNNVGLDNLVLYDLRMMDGRLVDRSLPEPWIFWQAEMDRLSTERRIGLVAARAALLLLLAGAVWRLAPAPAAVLSMVAIFAMTLLTCYYWIMLLIVPMGRRMAPVFGALLLQVFAFGLHLYQPAFEMRYGLLSWGLAALWLAWCLPSTLKTICFRRAVASGELSPRPGVADS